MMIVENVRVFDVNQTCFACPSQWDVLTSTRQMLFVRYRHGVLEVCDGGPGGPVVFEKEIGDWLDGVMSWKEVLRHTGMRMV